MSSNIGTHGHTGAGETSGTDTLVKTGEYSTGLEAQPGAYPTNTAVPIVGNSYQNRVSGVAGAPGVVGAPGSGDGLAVGSSIGGPLGGSVVLGGQCECTMNGGTCSHGAGKCVCRGCTTRATTVNPGINIGVSTTQYTAPVGTTGIGGGVADPGVGIAGRLQPVNSSGAYVAPSDANCECVKKGGSCNCAPGQCKCENCSAKRSSMQHTSAGAGGAHHHHHHHHHNNAHAETHRIDQGGIAPIAGTEYTSPNGNPDAAYKSHTTTSVNTAGTGTSGPLTDNSNLPYKPSDYTTGKPVTNG